MFPGQGEGTAKPDLPGVEKTQTGLNSKNTSLILCWAHPEQSQRAGAPSEAARVAEERGGDDHFKAATATAPPSSRGVCNFSPPEGHPALLHLLQIEFTVLMSPQHHPHTPAPHTSSLFIHRMLCWITKPSKLLLQEQPDCSIPRALISPWLEAQGMGHSLRWDAASVSMSPPNNPPFPPSQTSSAAEMFSVPFDSEISVVARLQRRKNQKHKPPPTNQTKQNNKNHNNNNKKGHQKTLVKFQREH